MTALPWEQFSPLLQDADSSVQVCRCVLHLLFKRQGTHLLCCKWLPAYWGHVETSNAAGVPGHGVAEAWPLSRCNALFLCSVPLQLAAAALASVSAQYLLVITDSFVC